MSEDKKEEKNISDKSEYSIIDFALGSEAIYFDVDELEDIQSSDDPFTYEEIIDLLDEELKRPPNEINQAAVEFYLKIIFE